MIPFIMKSHCTVPNYYSHFIARYNDTDKLQWSGGSWIGLLYMSGLTYNGMCIHPNSVGSTRPGKHHGQLSPMNTDCPFHKMNCSASGREDQKNLIGGQRSRWGRAMDRWMWKSTKSKYFDRNTVSFSPLFSARRRARDWWTLRRSPVR